MAKGKCKECPASAGEKDLINKLCKKHYWQGVNKKAADKKREKDKQEIEAGTKKVYEFKKPTKPIAPRSKRRAAQEVIYEKNKKEYIAEVETCEFPDCDDPRVQLHHGKGRTETLIYDKKYFVCLCDYHHRWAHEHWEEAVAMGIMVLRSGDD